MKGLAKENRALTPTQLRRACLLVMLGWPCASAEAQRTSGQVTNAGVSLPSGVVIDGPPPPIPPATMSRDEENHVTCGRSLSWSR